MGLPAPGVGEVVLVGGKWGDGGVGAEGEEHTEGFDSVGDAVKVEGAVCGRHGRRRGAEKGVPWVPAQWRWAVGEASVGEMCSAALAMNTKSSLRTPTAPDSSRWRVEMQENALKWLRGAGFEGGHFQCLVESFFGWSGRGAVIGRPSRTPRHRQHLPSPSAAE